MIPSLALVVAGGILIACGVYLILERSILRIMAGVILASNGVNLLFLVASGAAGRAPIIGEGREEIADPLPQAFVLTAIVISLAASAFMLALSYRSFQLDGHDEVADDVEDALVRRRAEADMTSASFAERPGVDDDTESGGVQAPDAVPEAALPDDAAHEHLPAPGADHSDSEQTIDPEGRG
ncbi:Na(+)/H(+) antiporter subunit C [Agrococcus jejuensis]|uniref:Na(+)/H(+) antiporter subunit C n=1 Tax=Agrococcus jejuensis TaxID=399736 RepID=UPI0011A3FDB5|nr:Na(+)/H(+) antiporter subunit C [Agrococcus jejuensis]